VQTEASGRFHNFPSKYHYITLKKRSNLPDDFVAFLRHSFQLPTWRLGRQERFPIERFPHQMKYEHPSQYYGIRHTLNSPSQRLR